MFPPNLPVPALEVPFRPWKSHVMWSITLPISLPASSGLGSPMSCGKFVSLGCPISCGKFLLPSPYLPVPTLHVPSPVVKFLFPSPCLPVPNSCGTCFLPTCQFRPWKSHSGLGSPMSCGKFLFPSPYLPVPALEVPCHVVNSSPLDVPSPAANSSYSLPTCQFPP